MTKRMKLSSGKIKKRRLTTPRVIALAFAAIILIGTALLMLPAASRNGVSAGFRTAAFTATSATCVTGLVLCDTWTQWSGFGQCVILAMIEIGGLGFMSAASVIIFALRRKMNMSLQMMIAGSIGTEDMAGIMRVQKRILAVGLGIQGIGALLLTLRFRTDYDFAKSAALGIFHAVSAFCNAGFDIFGFESPGSSIALYGTDPIVIFVLSFLIVAGGIGFLVWDELAAWLKGGKMGVYAKLVLVSTGVLLAFGTVMFCLTEWQNPETLGGMKFGEKLIAAFFQSVTTRTAGFAGFDQGCLSEGGKAVTMFLMLIGGSSGSTAGGLKTVTMLVLLLFLWSRIRGRETVHIFCRTISQTQVLNAVTLFGVMIVCAFFGGTLIAATSPVGFTDGLYEAVSALATVGLTTGVTPSLSLAAQILMMLYMYFGRVGILTISLGFLQNNRAEKQYQYAETNLLIG